MGSVYKPQIDLKNFNWHPLQPPSYLHFSFPIIYQFHVDETVWSSLCPTVPQVTQYKAYSVTLWLMFLFPTFQAYNYFIFPNAFSRTISKLQLQTPKTSDMFTLILTVQNTHTILIFPTFKQYQQHYPFYHTVAVCFPLIVDLNL